MRGLWPRIGVIVDCPRVGDIIDCPQINLYHNAHDIIITSQMAIRELDKDDDIAYGKDFVI